jgi:hypothetical protein
MVPPYARYTCLRQIKSGGWDPPYARWNEKKYFKPGPFNSRILPGVDTILRAVLLRVQGVYAFIITKESLSILPWLTLAAAVWLFSWAARNGRGWWGTGALKAIDR